MLQRNSQTKSNFPQFYLQHQPHLLQSSTNKPSSQSHFQSNLRQKQVTNHFSQRQRIIQIPIQIPLFNGEKSFVYKRPKWIQIQLNKIKQKEGSQMQEVIQWLQLILKRKKNEMERLIEKQMEGQQRQEKYKQFVNDLLKIQNIIRVQLEEKINQEIKIKNKSTTDFDNITDKKITSIDQIQKQQNINEKDSLIIKMINQVQMQIKALLNKKQNILKLIQGNKYEITSKRKGIHRKEYQKINFRSDVKEKLEENQYEQQLLIKQMQKNKGEEKQDKQVRDENQQISSEQYNESEQIEREVEGYMIDQKNQKVDKIEKIYMQKLNQRKKIQQKKIQKPIQVFVDRIIQKPIQVFVDRIVQKEVFVQKPIQVFVDRIIQKEVFVQKPIQVFVDRIIQKPIQVFVDRIIQKEVFVQKPIQVFVDRKKPNQQIFPQFYKISQNVNIIQQIPQNPQQNSLTTQLILSKDKIKQRLQQENHNNNKQSSQNVEKKNLQISSTIQILKLINFDAIKSQSNADINKLTSSINISQFTESNQQQKKQQSNLYPPQQNTKQYQERQKILIQNIREFNDMISKKKHQLQKLQNQISNKSLIQEKQTLIAIQKIHQKELVQKIQILQKQNHQLKQQLEKSKMMIKTELSQNLKLKRQNSNIYKQYQQNKRNTQRTNQKNDQTIKQLIQEINNMKTLQNKNNIQKTETITRYNELIQENQSLKLMIQQYKKQIIQQTLAVIKYKETLLQGDSVINLIVQQKQDIYKKLNELQVNRFDNLSNQQTSLEKQMVIRNTDSYYDSNLSQKPLVKKHKQKLNIENFNKQQIIKLIQQYSEEIQQSQIIIQQLTTKIKQFQTIINYQRKQINKLKQNTLQKRVPQRSSSQKFSKQNYDIKNYDQLQIKATSVYQDLYQIIQKANIDEYIKQQIQSIMKQVQSQKYINQQLQKRVIQCQKKILQKTQSINHLKLTLLKKQSDNIFLNQFKTQQQSMKHTIKNQNNQKRKLSNQSSQIKIYQSQYLYKQDHDYHIRTKQLEQRIRHYELNLIPDLRDQLARYIQKLGIVDDDDDITPRQIYKKQINRTNYQKQSINNQKNQREILEQNIKKFKYQSQQFKNSISKEMHTPPIKGERFEQNKSHSKKLKANPKGLSISSKMKPISLENFIHTESVGKIGIFTIMLRLVEAAQQMINQKKFFTLHPKRIFILNFNEEQFENIQVRIQNLELHETEKDIELFTAPEVLKGQKQNQSSVLWNLGILFDYLINKSLFFKSKYLISSKINYKYENNNLICAKRILQKLLNKSPYSRLNLENLQLNIKFQLKRLLYPK